MPNPAQAEESVQENIDKKESNLNTDEDIDQDEAAAAVALSDTAGKPQDSPKTSASVEESFPQLLTSKESKGKGLFIVFLAIFIALFSGILIAIAKNRLSKSSIA